MLTSIYTDVKKTQQGFVNLKVRGEQMKVVHTFSVANLRGKQDNSVYYPSPSEKFSIVRKFVYPTITAHNNLMGTKMANLRNIWNTCNPLYQADLIWYAGHFYSENKDLPNFGIPLNNGFAALVKAAFAWEATDPETIDLTTVTVADIVLLNEGMLTVKSMVDDGYLPTVEGFETLTQLISVA